MVYLYVHTAGLMNSVGLDSVDLSLFTNFSAEFAHSVVEVVTGVIDKMCSTVAMFG